MEISPKSVEIKHPSLAKRALDFVIWHAIGKHEVDEAVRRSIAKEQAERIPGYPVTTMDMGSGEVHAYNHRGEEAVPHTPSIVKESQIVMPESTIGSGPVNKLPDLPPDPGIPKEQMLPPDAAALREPILQPEPRDIPRAPEMPPEPPRHG